MLYGRAAETAAITDLLASAAAGEGGALVLRGDAGVGKSALLSLAASLAASPAASPVTPVAPSLSAEGASAGVVDGVREGAPGRAMRVLRAGGFEPEADLAFAALHQLLRPVTGLLEALPGPQRDAVAGALGLAAPSSDRFLVSAGVLSLLTEAAVPDGLLCLVDDVQWLDRASADALLFAARRLRTEGVAMLLAVRGDMPVKGLPELRVGGLDAAGAGDLLGSRAAVAPAVRDRLVALSGGNPLVLRETVTRLTAGQLSGQAPLPDPLPGGEQLFGDQVAGLSEAARLVLLAASLESDLDVTLRASARLLEAAPTSHATGPAGTPPRTAPGRAVTWPEAGIRAVAAGSQEADVSAATPGSQAADIGAVTPGSRAADVGAAVAGLQEAEAAGLVGVEGSTVRFRHPLVRSAVHAWAGSVRLRQAHGVLAALVEGDRRAWHLAAASLGPDEDVAAALALSAARARARGGYGDAATALARAAELTPAPVRRAERLVEAATAAWLAGRPGQAQTLLTEARDLAEAMSAVETASAGTTASAGETASTSEAASTTRTVSTGETPSTTNTASAGETASTSEAASTARTVSTGETPSTTKTASAGHTPSTTKTTSTDQAASTGRVGKAGLVGEIARLRGRFELNSGDAAEAVRILSGGDSLEALADASEAASYVGDVAAIVELGRRARAHPPGFLRDVVAGIGAMMDPGAADGEELLRAALARTGELREAAEFLWACAAASYLGEADLSAELAGRAGAVARMSGIVGQLPVVLEFVATAERIKGRLAESAAIAEEGLTLAREAGYTNSVGAHLANLAVVAALRGEEEDCRRNAAEALAIAVPHRVGLRAGVAAYALAMLDLGLGRFEAAHARFVAITRAGPGAGHPTVVWRSTPDRVEAAMAAGDPEAARAAVEGLERWAASATTAEARALLARCRALAGGGDELFEEALRLHGEPFEEARTALLYGERLRRAGRPGQARAHLRAAMEAFQRLGAEPWARRAHGELRAAGETAARPESDALAALTPQELRIARLVAAGASSKEVAAQLFLSPRTVEYHLYKVYPKLGVTSRTELARLL
ncbi:helix-turn-helix transcriptional regulator [Nonomuraea rhodomycinica]|uniref:AAA family ATPase n=1 Tax=Nonomuraea rhodomycinica TaxID=1712872 RepID=A0A7Y6ME97_9ACTN|nr:LuxR C-terminal-related transcriptional regulator [Nonomuraea rhodomycinica]NUW44672.1 AAA family ATPase [Nonomuraea rhodomycinica]